MKQEVTIFFSPLLYVVIIPIVLKKSIDRNKWCSLSITVQAKSAFHEIGLLTDWSSVQFLFYLCLSVAEPPTVVACVAVTKIMDIDTYFYDVNADHGSWPDDGFCRVISKVEINDGEPYTMTVEIMNVGGWNGVNSGHPGVMYNVIDEDNFDVVYFRLVLC